MFTVRKEKQLEEKTDLGFLHLMINIGHRLSQKQEYRMYNKNGYILLILHLFS